VTTPREAAAYARAAEVGQRAGRRRARAAVLPRRLRSDDRLLSGALLARFRPDGDRLVASASPSQLAYWLGTYAALAGRALRVDEAREVAKEVHA